MAVGNSNVAFLISAKDQTGRAFDNVKRNLKGVNDNVSQTTKRFDKLRGSIIGAFTVAAVRAVGNYVDELNNMSIKLGVATEDLSNWNYVAKINNVELETMSKSMLKNADSIAEAASGSASHAQALAALGLQAKDLINLPLDKQFEIVGGELAKVDNQAMKVKISMDLMGKSATDILPIFEAGKDSITELTAVAEALNITISQDQAEAIDEMNDAWDTLGMALMAVGKDIVAVLAPAFEFLAKAMTKVILTARNVGKTIVGGFAAASIKVQDWAGIIEDDVADGAMQSLMDETLNWDKMWGNATDTQNTEDLNKSLDKTLQRYRAINRELEENNKKSKESKKTNDSKSDSSDDKVKESKEDVEELDETTKILLDNIESGVDRVGDSLADMITGAGEGFQSFGDMARGIIMDISREIIKSQFKALVQPYVTDLTTSITDSGGIGSWFQGFFADGGDTMPGKAMVTGERGAEIWTPRQSGTVIPLDKIGRGGDTRIIFNITTPDVRGFKQSQSQLTAQAASALRAAQRNM